MSDENQTQAVTTVPKPPIAMGERGLLLSTFDDLWRFSVAVSKSGFAPKGMQSPESIMIAIQMGLEVGMSPMSALQNTAVINGRPGIYGDAALALVRASGLLGDDFEEVIVGEGDEKRCIVTSTRIGMKKPRVTTFSVANAKEAQLWGKPGPWTQYPERMLQFRARGFNLRDNFGDVLKGMRTVEELRDMPSFDVESTVEPKPQPTFTKAEPEKKEANPKPKATKQTKSEPEPSEPDPEPETPPAENARVKEVYELLAAADGVTEPDVITVLKRKKMCAQEAEELGAIADDKLARIIENWEVIVGQAKIDKRGAA